MAKAARIVRDTVLSRGRFELTRTEIAVIEDDGASRTLAHEVYRHGMAAAVLLYDSGRGVVALVKQFRAGAYLADGALATIEACAGMLDGDAPDVCVIREAQEETGIVIRAPRHAFDAYMSPGGMTEKIACFVAPYGEADRTGKGGGVDEDEHIEVLEIPFDEALAMIERGEIADAKTIALLYYAKAKGLIAADVRRAKQGRARVESDVDFKVQFLDSEVARLVERYRPELDNDCLASGARILGGEYLKENLQVIYRWKMQAFSYLGGEKRNFDRNAEGDIAKVLQIVVTELKNSDDPSRSLRDLQSLIGIGLPSASAILMAIFPNRFTVIDVMALRALGIRRKLTIDYGVYKKYLMFCREASQYRGISLRDFDRALWQWGHENRRRISN